MVVRVADAGDIGALASLRSLWALARRDPDFERRIEAWLASDGDRRTTWLAVSATRWSADVPGRALRRRTPTSTAMRLRRPCTLTRIAGRHVERQPGEARLQLVTVPISHSRRLRLAVSGGLAGLHRGADGLARRQGHPERRQSLSLVVTATSEDLLASLSGTVSLPGASKVYKLTGVKDRFVARGSKATLKVQVPKKVLAAIKRGDPQRREGQGHASAERARRLPQCRCQEAHDHAETLTHRLAITLT